MDKLHCGGALRLSACESAAVVDAVHILAHEDPRMLQCQAPSANQITARIGLRPIKGMSGRRLWY